jgi:hypothetical protein
MKSSQEKQAGCETGKINNFSGIKIKIQILNVIPCYKTRTIK